MVSVRALTARQLRALRTHGRAYPNQRSEQRRGESNTAPSVPYRHGFATAVVPPPNTRAVEDARTAFPINRNGRRSRRVPVRGRPGDAGARASHGAKTVPSTPCSAPAVDSHRLAQGSSALPEPTGRCARRAVPFNTRCRTRSGPRRHPVPGCLRGPDAFNRTLACPSPIGLSSRAPRYPTGQLASPREEIGTRWRRLTADRQVRPGASRSPSRGVSRSRPDPSGNLRPYFLGPAQHVECVPRAGPGRELADEFTEADQGGNRRDSDDHHREKRMWRLADAQSNRSAGGDQHHGPGTPSSPVLNGCPQDGQTCQHPRPVHRQRPPSRQMRRRHKQRNGAQLIVRIRDGPGQHRHRANGDYCDQDRDGDDPAFPGEDVKPCPRPAVG